MKEFNYQITCPTNWRVYAFVVDPFCWTQAQKRARIHKLRLEKGAAKAAEELEKCEDSFIIVTLLFFVGLHSPNAFFFCCICFNVDDPHNDPNVSGDPYKTLFIARLVSYIV